MNLEPGSRALHGMRVTSRSRQILGAMSGCGPSRPCLKNSCPQCPVCGRLRVGKSFLHVADWSVQPCVRPTSAVHMTAGHNALRGSGPDRKPAFENASGQVGCPDRRNDRLCITCCWPSQPSHHVGCPTRSATPQARRVPCSARPWPSSPRLSAQSYWRAQWQRPWWDAAPTTP